MNGWRESKAGTCDVEAAVLEHAIDALEDAHAVLEARRRGSACGELRATTSTLRLEMNTIASEASELRAHREPGPLPMVLTTRYPRRRPAAAETREELPT